MQAAQTAKQRPQRNLFEPGVSKPRAAAAKPTPAASAALPDSLIAILTGLDPQSVRDASPNFAPLLASLQDGETVSALVQGWVKGSACIVARTDFRLILVVSRTPKALVQSLNVSTVEISISQPDRQGFSTMRLLDGTKMLQVQGIRDAGSARQLQQGQAGQQRSAPDGQGQGFF